MIDTKNKILAAASHLFLEGGLSALNVRAIASRAGVSTIGIYSHFQGKQGILDQLYIQAYDYIYEAANVPRSIVSPRKQLLQVAENYLKAAKHHEGHYRLIFGESGASFTPSPEAKQARTRAFNRLVKIVANLLPESATQLQQEETTLELWALVHGYVSLGHHAVTELAQGKHWQRLVLTATANHIDAIEATDPRAPA